MDIFFFLSRFSNRNSSDMNSISSRIVNLPPNRDSVPFETKTFPKLDSAFVQSNKRNARIFFGPFLLPTLSLNT